MRILAKGKKLGALVGFTFRQPAILQALGLSDKSRQLSSYLMYEPFQRAWTQTVKPSQTITLCEGGGVIYRHPRVQVTLWLDHYVTEIYPNWTRNGNSLLQLATLAAERQPLSVSASIPATAFGSSKPEPKPVLKPAVLSGSSKPASKPATAFRSSKPASQSILKLTVLSGDSHPPSKPSASSGCSKPALVIGLTRKPVLKPAVSSGSSKAVSSGSSKPALVIDLTGTTPKLLKRKRAFVPPVQLVDISVEDEGKQTKRKRARMGPDRAKPEGKGTSSDPYVL